MENWLALMTGKMRAKRTMALLIAVRTTAMDTIILIGITTALQQEGTWKHSVFCILYAIHAVQVKQQEEQHKGKWKNLATK